MKSEVETTGVNIIFSLIFSQTTIVAIVYDKGVLIGADSRTTMVFFLKKKQSIINSFIICNFRELILLHVHLIKLNICMIEFSV